MSLYNHLKSEQNFVKEDTSSNFSKKNNYKNLYESTMIHWGYSNITTIIGVRHRHMKHEYARIFM